VPDRRYVIYQLQHFADKGQWEAFENTIHKHNVKKRILVPWDEVAYIAYEHKSQKEAEKYIVKSQDFDKKLDFLRHI